MRQWTTVVMAMLAGCGGRQSPPPNGAISPAFVCPDKNCTHNNGTGVYYAEDGFAGIGDSQLMITHFINSGSGVTFQGRYFEQSSGMWRSLAKPGTIERVEYPNLDNPIVRAVTEQDTVPRWTLQGPRKATMPAPKQPLGTAAPRPPLTAPLPARRPPLETASPQGPAPTPSTPSTPSKVPRPSRRPLLTAKVAPLTQVSGAELRDLKLHVSFWVGPDDRRRYVLDFAGPIENELPNGAPYDPSLGKRQPAKLAMRWRLDSSTAPPPTAYCKDAQGHDDTVVFQRGIQVEPVIGAVAADPSAVTLSCSLGAPAQVYAWRYDYDPARADLFDLFRAGIHMKRASYCADSAFYTSTGTALLVGDSLGINRDLPTARTRAAELEAWWTPQGASCLNEAALRQPAIAEQKGFHGVCKQQKLPPCELPPAAPSSERYLIDARAPR